jgi:hypothetical protein
MGAKGVRRVRLATSLPLTADCEPIVYKIWEPRRLTILWVSTVCYRDSVVFYIKGRQVQIAFYSHIL